MDKPAPYDEAVKGSHSPTGLPTIGCCSLYKSRGAHVLKALVGDDQLSGELKNLNATPPILGKFDVVITCNSHLRVKLDGDAEAWRRRVMIVTYERPKPEVRISRFAEELLETEGPGILRFGVEGAMMHLRELEELADFRLTPKQNAV